MDKCSELHLHLEDQRPNKIHLKDEAGDNLFIASIGKNYCDLFEGHVVLLTMSKNNELVWIKDWIEINYKINGVTAILFYDNGSTKYKNVQLLETISAIEGIEVVAIVSWPFPYGPSGGMRHGQNIPWVFDFCQVSALNHARRRFLSKAKCVLNCDIDEIFIPPNNSSILDLCEKEEDGYVLLTGKWIYNIENISEEKQKHIGHKWLNRNDLSCTPKWAIIPSKLSSKYQWRVHSIYPKKISIEAFFYHFRQINTSWKYDRNIEKTSLKELVVDEDFAKCIDYSNYR